MIFRRISFGAGMLASLFAVSACSAIPGFGGGGDETTDDKGRVAMVLKDEALEANPELATVPIILPSAETRENWPQAGATASKVTGHVKAGEALEIAWRRDAGRGSDRRAALPMAPVADSQAIYVFDSRQTIRAFDLETGDRLWTQQLESENRRDNTGIGGGFAVSGDRLIVTSGFGYVLALDTETGDRIWRQDMDVPMTGAPTIKDGRVFVTSNNNEVFSLSPETGRIEWSDKAIAESARVLGSPSPAAIEDLVVVPYSSGELIAYLATNGRRLWTDALSRPGRFTPISAINDIAARPILSQGLVIAANQSGVTVGIDGRSGNRVWAKPIGSTQAPALVGDFLFIAGVDGTLAALNATNGNVFWVTRLEQFKNPKKKRGRITHAGPLVASDRIITISSQGRLVAHDPQNGEEIKSLDLRDEVFLEPIAVGDMIYVLTDDARLIAIR